MITNQKCVSCAFQSKCVAKNKLKPFTDNARVDLGVELEFVNCADYKEIGEENGSNNVAD